MERYVFLVSHFNRSFFKKPQKVIKCECLLYHTKCMPVQALHISLVIRWNSSLSFIPRLTSESLSWDRDAPILGNTVFTFISFFVQHWYRPHLP